MTSESFKTLILQNYSQKMILVRWFIVQLGIIAWFIEYPVMWHICPRPNRREDSPLWGFLPSLTGWWLLKLIYRASDWFAVETFTWEAEKNPNPAIYLLSDGCGGD